MAINIVFSSDGDAQQDLDEFAAFLVQTMMDALSAYAHRPDAIVAFDTDATKHEVTELGEALHASVRQTIVEHFDHATIPAKGSEN